MRRSLLFILAGMVLLFSCSRESDPPIPGGGGNGSPVNYDEDAMPFATLSEYGFFGLPLRNLQPVPGVLPYEVITPLFTDHAMKSRFIWMRTGSRAQYVADDVPFGFDDGTILIKNFFYDDVLPLNDRRVIETRLMIKRNGAWEFANYVWNAEQTEAYFDLAGSYTDVAWTDDLGAQQHVEYRIPSSAECLACHKEGSSPFPIGTKPQNMQMMIDRPDGLTDQLSLWVSSGYLAPGYPPIAPIADWKDASRSLQDRVRAYLDVNCSHCHSDQKYCDYRPIRLAWTETIDPAALGICIPPDEQIDPGITHIVAAGDPSASMIHFRLSATEENVRMPLLGRSAVHQEAVDLIADWIDSLDPPCN